MEREDWKEAERGRNRKGKKMNSDEHRGESTAWAGRETGPKQPMNQPEWRGEELMRSEDFRRLVELLPDMVFLISRGRYLYANPSALRILGASGPEELVGKPVGEMIHPEFQKR
jgi:PAS domain-containing protein